jgi:hypothetical protein
MAGFKKGQFGVENKIWFQNYTVTEDVFTVSWASSSFTGTDNYYGLGSGIFNSPGDTVTTTTGFLNSAHRFIGAHENDGNRWGVGDTVNIFLVDYEHT